MGGTPTPPLTGTQPDGGPAAGELLAVALRLALAAAQVLRQPPADLQVQAKSTPTDAVTVMDRAAERVVLDGLAADRPDDTVVSEESATRAGSSGVTWWVDPLDGTVNYLYGIPRYAVSVAAGVDGTVVAGVVVDVDREVSYTATRGGGAWSQQGGQPPVRLRCSDQSDPALALIGTGFAYAASVRTVQARTVAAMLPQVRDIRRLGSAALDLCSVATAEVDGFYERDMHEWDYAAGSLVAQESGAVFSSLTGGDPGRLTAVAANPALHQALSRALVEAAADAAPGDGG